MKSDVDMLTKFWEDKTFNIMPKQIKIPSKPIIISGDIIIKEKKIVSINNIKIMNNKIYGIKGITGSGKSTFLLGLIGYRPGIFWSTKKDPLSYHSNIVYMNKKISDNDTIKHFFQQYDDEILDTNRIIECISDSGLIEWYKKNIIDLDTTISGLSDGEKTRIYLARTLYNSHNKQWIVLDEPDQGIDIATSYKILKHVLIKYKKKGFTIFIITHKLEGSNNLPIDELWNVNNGIVTKCKDKYNHNFI